MRTTPLLAAALAAATLVACGGTDGAASAPTADDTRATAGAAFPATVEHAFGETVVESQPTRVVTLGWGATEAAIALGVTPIAYEEQVFAAGAGEQLPWVEEAVPADQLPELLPNDFTTPAYEAIIALEPDLILAQYSGYGEEAYEVLSDIAPTVAYPDQPWATPWRDVIAITADALGRPEAGEQVLTELDAWFAEQAAAHPEFDGVSVANVYDGDGFVSVYTSADPRVSVMTDLGFEVADAVDATDTDEAPANFYYELSYERVDELDSDVVVTYHSTPEEAAAFLDKPEVAAIPAVGAGDVAQVVGNARISAVSPPNALSIEWGMPDLVATLAEVVGG